MWKNNLLSPAIPQPHLSAVWCAGFLLSSEKSRQNEPVPISFLVSFYSLECQFTTFCRRFIFEWKFLLSLPCPSSGKEYRSSCKKSRSRKGCKIKDKKLDFRLFSIIFFYSFLFGYSLLTLVFCFVLFLLSRWWELQWY